MRGLLRTRDIRGLILALAPARYGVKSTYCVPCLTQRLWAESLQAKSLSQSLYTALLRKLVPWLQDRRVYVVGHRFLHFVPFEAFHDGKQDYAVVHFTFAYFLTAAVMSYLKSKNALRRNILGLWKS